MEEVKIPLFEVDLDTQSPGSFYKLVKASSASSKEIAPRTQEPSLDDIDAIQAKIIQEIANKVPPIKKGKKKAKVKVGGKKREVSPKTVAEPVEQESAVAQPIKAAPEPKTSPKDKD